MSLRRQSVQIMTTSSRFRNFFRTHGRYLLAVLAVTAVMLFLWGQIDYTIPPYSQWDGWHYRQMAQAAPGISPLAAAPFRYRLLGTYPIGLLPLDTILAFRIVNYTLFAVLTIICYLFLCYVGIRRSVAVYTVALFTMSTYLFGVTAWYTFHTNDVLALIFLLTALWGVMARRWGVFALSLFLGALSRETWILVPPTAFVYLWEHKRLAADWKKLVLASIPPLVVLVSLRLLLPIDIPGNIDIPKAFIRYSPKILEPEFWARQFGNSLKPLTFLPLIFFSTTLAYFKANKFMLALIFFTFVSSLLGSADERLMAPAFVAFYWLFAMIFERDIYPHKGMLALIAVCSFVSTFHYRQARFPLPSRELTIYLGLVTWVIVTVAAVIFKLKTTRRPAPPNSPALPTA